MGLTNEYKDAIINRMRELLDTEGLREIELGFRASVEEMPTLDVKFSQIILPEDVK